jgi:hypothetical protein
MWQEAGVLVVVGGAVVYLARKLFGIGVRPKKKPAGFVPLSSLKKKQ